MVSGDGSEKKVGGKGIRIWPKSGLTELNRSLTASDPLTYVTRPMPCSYESTKSDDNEMYRD